MLARFSKLCDTMQSMKNVFAVVAGLLAVGGILAGCNDAGPQKLDENYMKSGEELGKQRRDLFMKAGGDYEKLSAEDKAAYLKSFNNDETQAKNFWTLMANPPSSGVRPGMPGTAPGQ